MDIDAFILIGGLSSRLGVDKALVEFNGETLAARCARIIGSALSPNSITFVSRNESQFGTDLSTTLGHRVIADLRPGLGAWSGIHASLANARSEWAFILACDLPFISPELLRLIAGFVEDGIDAVVPRQRDERLQPLCAFYRRQAALATFDGLFDQKSVPPVNTIVHELKTRIVEPDEYSDLPNAEKLFLNINTENDLAAALS